MKTKITKTILPLMVALAVMLTASTAIFAGSSGENAAAKAGASAAQAASPDIQKATGEAAAALAEPGKEAGNANAPWWIWPSSLFAVSLGLGVLAVLGGVGGGVLFVPIIGGFFPFHIDFVRGAGLLVALAGALAAGPGLLKRNLASLRLSIPVALIASAAAIGGALVGLALSPSLIQALLGAAIILIVIIMSTAKKSDFPNVPRPDGLSRALGIMGIYREESIGKEVEWHVHRTPKALATFVVIGFMAGMFGLGAGWANVPVLNLMMGAPLKVSVASSKFLLSITDTSAAWIFINKGAVIPMMVVPSIVGIMLGSIIGVKILAKSKPKAIKWMVIGLLFFAGVRALLKGLGIWA